MSVVIVGGNECMVRKYKELCEAYSYSAKIFPKTNSSLKEKIGNPNLLVLFTNTMSHKMLNSALDATKNKDTTIARCHTSSMSALKNILEEHTKGMI